MLRSTTISIRSAISSLARFTNKDEPARWPSGAPSRPSGRLGLGVLRHTQATCRYSDKAAKTAGAAHKASRGGTNSAKVLSAGAPFLSLAVVLAIMVTQNPKTASVFGLDLLLWASVPVALVSLGQMFVVGGSEIDLGIG